MNLATTILLAGEEMVEREGVGKVPGLRAAMPQSSGQKQSGWQYGFRHPVGYLPTRQLAGLPSPGHGGHGHLGAPKVPASPHVHEPHHPVKAPPRPKMPHAPAKSIRGPLMKPAGHFKPNVSMPRVHMPKAMPSGGMKMPKMRLSGTEAKEPPEGAYSKDNTHETKEWFEEKPMKAEGTSEGAQKGWDTRGRSENKWKNPYNPSWTKEQMEHWQQNAHGTGKPVVWNPQDRSAIEHYNEAFPQGHPMAVHVHLDPPDQPSSWHEKLPQGIDEETLKELEENFGYKPPMLEAAGGPGAANVGMITPKSPLGNWRHMKRQAVGRHQGSKTHRNAKHRNFDRFKKEVGEEAYRKRRVGAVEADDSGEPTATMQHIHIQPVDTYHPPSLVKRKKQTHVPVDDVGETDDKWLDVTKRNSKDTWEQRMKMLKRSAPGGAPAQIPARTTLIPEHSGIWLPTSMMSAARKKPLPNNQRPINWDKQPRQRTSYARRGCI